jgi:hypothetical protein
MEKSFTVQVQGVYLAARANKQKTQVTIIGSLVKHHSMNIKPSLSLVMTIWENSVRYGLRFKILLKQKSLLNWVLKDKE